MTIAREFFLSCFRDLIRPCYMKCVAAITFVSVAFVSHALAVLRPIFPAKAGPPFNNEAIITGNGSIHHPAKRPCGTALKQRRYQRQTRRQCLRDGRGLTLVPTDGLS